MSRQKILVVEDEALVAADIEQRLQSLGYEVAGVVDTGEDAVAMAASSGPDLALMDIRLRGRMTGIDAAGILRERHSIPVVYLTSHADADTLARAGSTEPFGYIVKPFGENDLHATIEMAFYRARAEERLARMERWLATTLDSIGDGVIATDLLGQVTYLNRAAERLTGWLCREALMKPVDDVFDLESKVPGSPAMRLIAKAIEREGPIHLEQRRVLKARDGRTFPIDDSAAPIRDEAGSVIGVVLVFRDRTEQEQMAEQRRSIERKMQDTQKLESLGVLAGGIAHDFNNLLTGIVGNTSLALLQIPADSPVRECLDDVRLASQRAADLIRQMLAYSGKGQFIISQINLSTLVDETARLIGMSVSKRARLDLRLPASLPSVAADAAQIRQVVMNLVINASEALGEQGGSIRVTTGRVRADRAVLDAAVNGESLAEGDYVYFEVADTGSGISAENLRRIFDPFFTTKFTGRGLGLAAVQGIVRAHGGALTVQTAEGRGTTFRVLLPVAVGAVSAKVGANEAEPDLVNWRGEGTVLIIDDEPFVCTTAKHILGLHGFTVTTAGDGREGLAEFEGAPGKFVLVLLDLTMPHLDGLKVFDGIRRADPNARIILMSGFGEGDATEAFAGRDLAGFLQKPFDAQTLISVIRRALA